MSLICIYDSNRNLEMIVELDDGTTTKQLGAGDYHEFCLQARPCPMCTNLLISVPSNPGHPADPARTHVSARALELPGAVAQSVYVMASGQKWPLHAHHAPKEVHGWTRLHWTNKYGFVGIAATDSWDSIPTFNDGINTAGLSIGGLWFAPGTEFPPVGKEDNQVSFFDFPAWVLGNFATVEEFRKAFGEITVVGPPPPTKEQTSKLYIPLHYIVTDHRGQSIVVEFIGGKGILYDSHKGVLTNWPSYDWQTQNVENYYNLTPYGTATSATGAGHPGGGGLQGLPGDPLSASRFVKAWVLTEGIHKLPADGRGWLPAPGAFATTPPSKNPPAYAGPEQTAVTVAQQLVQICMGTPYGMLVVETEDSPATTGTPATKPPTYTTSYGDYTMWTTVRDHTNRKYYFSSAFSGLLTKIDLAEIDFTTATPYPHAANLAVVPQPGVPWCVDATSKLAPATL
jgi:penicillin V acylase-like amidase (Ntn superfamily)